MIEKQILENQIVIIQALLAQLPSASNIGQLLQETIINTNKLLGNV